MEDAQKLLAIFPQYFDPDNPPPSTLVQVGKLFSHDALIKIEVSAVIG